MGRVGRWLPRCAVWPGMRGAGFRQAGDRHVGPGSRGAPTLPPRSEAMTSGRCGTRPGPTGAALFGVSEGVPMSVLFAVSTSGGARDRAGVLPSGMARTLWLRPITRSGRPSGKTPGQASEENVEDFVAPG